MLRDEIGLGFEPGAPFSERVLEFSQGVKAAVDQWLVRQGPDAFSRLQFWRVGRQRHRLQATGMSLRWMDMKSRAIFNEQDVMVWPRPETGRECGHDELVGAFGDLWHQPELAGATFRTDKGIQVQPFIAWLDGPGGGVARGCPDGPRDGLEADAMFIHGPQRDVRVEPLRCAKPLH
ncbi:hypothetical protein QR90_09385 [Deinococcus radiopugnans]|uniref:Uncharacterized protein n=1 Tax=Deinococcus radiopugnans TaxID=57497 RepID=A0A0A7KKJ5_9DEIO|nr:hypothetical protein QR90_08055 [Deinococcus radiopugnans]AIZ45265.1 hypothetical protein QR90_09385 [Deinococcus radiopugnans]